MTFFRKTALVQAVQWKGNNLREIVAFLGDDFVSFDDDGFITVNTLEGYLRYPMGYFLIKNPKGNHYGSTEDEWLSNYEAVEDVSVERGCAPPEPDTSGGETRWAGMTTRPTEVPATHTKQVKP